MHRKRIYILATRTGAGFGMICVLLLLGAMNYSNSLAFALCFLLTGLFLVAMQHTHRNLLGLTLSSSQNRPVLSGQPASFGIRIQKLDALARYAVGLRFMDTDAVQWLDVRGNDPDALQLQTPARERGWCMAPCILVTTRYPFGLFNAWSYVRLDTRVMVYPQPENTSAQPPPTQGAGYSRQTSSSGQEDYAGLRPYQPGDSPHHIHWRAYPRHDELLVKQFANPYGEEIWLDWDTLPGLPPEQRLSRLCRWVIEAHRDGQKYGLRLPGLTVRPDAGEAHRHRCLSALALYPA